MHRKLGDALLTQIESDLVERPEGRVTYKEIFDHYGLKARGISWAAFGRYAQYVCAMHRVRTIRYFADRITGIEGLDDKNIGLIKARLFETLMDPEAKPGDILNITIADNTAARTMKLRAELEARKRELKIGIDQLAAKEGTRTVDADKVADMIDRVMRGEDING